MASDTTLQLGKNTVRIALRADNPAFPQYLFFSPSGALIGKQFSCPTLSDCQWLERDAGYCAAAKWKKRELRGAAALRARATST